MTGMENRASGRVEVPGLVWTISSLTSLVEACLDSWNQAEDATEAGGEEKIWCTL